MEWWVGGVMGWWGGGVVGRWGGGVVWWWGGGVVGWWGELGYRLHSPHATRPDLTRDDGDLTKTTYSSTHLAQLAHGWRSVGKKHPAPGSAWQQTAAGVSKVVATRFGGEPADVDVGGGNAQAWPTTNACEGVDGKIGLTDRSTP